MGPTSTGYEQLMARFVRWAREEDNIRAAVLIGSRARVDRPADEWADLDVIILARDPEPYWTTADWLCNVGVPWLTFVEPTPDGKGFERRVLFEGGLDVDFAPDAVAGFEHMLDQGFDPVTADMVRRGVRFLVDKDGLSERLQSAQIAPPAASLPTEPEFQNLVHDFWFHTVWTGKHLRRGELWRAKSCCDTYLKGLLLRMLEWHAWASRGSRTDTWMGGRFVEDWADPRALAALPSAFARYEEQDIWRALEATMDLFHRLAVETATWWEYTYPSSDEERARDLVRRMLSGESLW